MPKTPAVLLIAVLLLAIASSHTSAGQSPGVGNSTGDIQRASPCPRGEALVGFRGGAGHLSGNTVIGRIRSVCTSPPGSFATPETVVNSRIGNLGARGHGRRTPNERHRCPHNTVAVGIRARGGDLVDRVQLICQGLNGKDQRTGPISYSGPMGGEGGKAKVVRCPNREYATGFSGTVRRGEHNVIDFLRLDCV